MSRALPGENYCLDHQGNHSHYDKHNCTVCKLREQNAAMLAALTRIADAETNLLFGGGEQIKAVVNVARRAIGLKERY